MQDSEWRRTLSSRNTWGLKVAKHISLRAVYSAALKGSLSFTCAHKPDNLFPKFYLSTSDEIKHRVIFTNFIGWDFKNAIVGELKQLPDILAI